MKGFIWLKNQIYQSEMCSAGSTGPAHFHGDDEDDDEDDDDDDDFIHTRTHLQNLNLLYVAHFLNWSNRIYPT